MSRARLSLIVSLASAAAVGVAHASPVDLFGFGARGQGMAGAIGATATGIESVYYNPAGLAYDDRPTFSLAYQFGALDLRYRVGDSGGLTRADALDTPALSIGFGVPLPFGGILKDRLAIGLGFVIPQTSIFIADIERPADPTFILIENRAQTVSIQAALSVRVSDWLALGVGTIALAELDGQIEVAPNAAGRIGSKVKDQLVADYAPVAGVLLRLLPEDGREDGAPERPPRHRLSMALTFRGESRADFDLPIEADLGDSFGIPIPEILVHGTAAFDPAELAFEASFRIVPELSVSIGAMLELWSTFPLPIAYAAVPEGTPPQPKPDFHDTIGLKTGLEGELTLARDVTFLPRLGFAFEPTPSPDQTGFHNHLDGDRTILALGVGVHVGRVRIDLAGQWHHLAQRTSTKVEGTAVTNPGFPSILSTGHILFGSLELGITL